MRLLSLRSLVPATVIALFALLLASLDYFTRWFIVIYFVIFALLPALVVVLAIDRMRALIRRRKE